MTVFYISPTGSGSHSGSSAANAGTIYDLPKFIAAASGGDEVRLLADQGAYKVTKQITIAAGGAAGSPITIRGAASDGTTMKATIVGTRAADWKPGLNEGVELFRLMDGSDHLKFADLATKNLGNGGNNTIVGNIGANTLSGGSGDDILQGGAGNDSLIGGQGADTYLVGRGSGSDLISNADTDLAADRVVFGAGVTAEDLWFTRSGTNLVVGVVGTSDRVTLQGWYSSTSNRLDHFELNDGATLAATQVQQLVDAMSAFTTPPSSLSTLTLAQQQSVESVIAANWH